MQILSHVHNKKKKKDCVQFWSSGFQKFVWPASDVFSVVVVVVATSAVEYPYFTLTVIFIWILIGMLIFGFQRKKLNKLKYLLCQQKEARKLNVTDIFSYPFNHIAARPI